MLAQEFIRNALLAGTPIALACGAIGYYVVLRSQVFAADTLSHVAFTGTLAAAAGSVDPRLGLFAASIAIALLLGGLGERAHADDVAIGIVLVWILGLGVFFLDLFNQSASGGSGITAARTLFGTIFGLSTSQAQLAAVIAIGVLAALLAISRPLLFATLDPQVAAARGVPVRLLGLLFLALLGIDAAEATQAVGALLLLGLIAAPAGAAHRFTANPQVGLTLSSLFALTAVWAGITLAYAIPSLPPSTAIIGVAVFIYVVAYTATKLPIAPAREHALRAASGGAPRPPGQRPSRV